LRFRLQLNSNHFYWVFLIDAVIWHFKFNDEIK
jgi:hypothetical protein